MCEKIINILRLFSILRIRIKKRGKMVSKKGTPEKDEVDKSFKPSDTTRKLVVLLCMIIIGILLIIYRSNYQYWAEQFGTYNQILFGVSIILLFMIIIVVIIVEIIRKILIQIDFSFL